MTSEAVVLPSASVAVASTPRVIVVEAVTPDLDAWHVLRTESAVKGPGPTFFTDAVLVTDSLPLVVTLISPEGGSGASGEAGGLPPKMTAGPDWAMAPSASTLVTPAVEPPAGGGTHGLALFFFSRGGFFPDPRTSGGPPQKLTSGREAEAGPF